MTDLQETKVCPKCGGEMVLRTRKADGGKFYACKNQECRTFENVDEYKPAKKSTSTAYKKTTSYSKPASSNKNPDDVVKELKKLYDEVTAEFAEDYPEIIGDAQALQALVATAFIERNKRL